MKLINYYENVVGNKDFFPVWTVVEFPANNEDDEEDAPAEPEA